MYIGRSQLDEEKYLQTTIAAISDLMSEYSDLSNEQDKEIRKQRRFLWENKGEFDEFEVLDNCSQIAFEEKMHAKKIDMGRLPGEIRIKIRSGKRAEGGGYGGAKEKEHHVSFAGMDWGVLKELALCRQG